MGSMRNVYFGHLECRILTAQHKCVDLKQISSNHQQVLEDLGIECRFFRFGFIITACIYPNPFKCKFIPCNFGLMNAGQDCGSQSSYELTQNII